MIIKKTTALFSSFFIMLLSLAGCGSGSNAKLVGTWVPTSASLSGQTMSYSDLELEDGYFELTFNSDGTCSATLAGISGTGTYVFNDTSVDMTINDSTRRLTYENSQLTLTMNYDDDTVSFTFIKDM